MRTLRSGLSTPLLGRRRHATLLLAEGICERTARRRGVLTALLLLLLLLLKPGLRDRRRDGERRNRCNDCCSENESFASVHYRLSSLALAAAGLDLS